FACSRLSTLFNLRSHVQSVFLANARQETLCPTQVHTATVCVSTSNPVPRLLSRLSAGPHYADQRFAQHLPCLPVVRSFSGGGCDVSFKFFLPQSGMEAGYPTSSH